MVARTPPTKEKRITAAMNPALLRETLVKVDKCMSRLQELQYTVSGGTKVISGVKLSPRSTKGYIKTSIRCKQEFLKIKNGGAQKSPIGKFQGAITGNEWKRMSLPAMIVGETVAEILQASQFTKQIVSVAPKPSKPRNRAISGAPKTPINTHKGRTSRAIEGDQMRTKRTREKQCLLKTIRSDPDLPARRGGARSRISFKSSPPNKREQQPLKETHHIANRVSPKHRPWAKKTVLFPNPLFLNSPSSHQRFSKTRSPVIAAKAKQIPHKFAIRSPPVVARIQSNSRGTMASKLRLSFSPSNIIE
ncbi:hypothetical protein QJS04_geneDACA003374 [Acorus gramineus]|uniref:Microtubule-binding protein TANGLED n=1 Tax=Acorus gramineus TaxID=55184 RepID=A0AAV9BPG7_ACOGR|nr:hypothetical protein QJS04_geneDACA003374 [Acorus gramineus]